MINFILLSLSALLVWASVLFLVPAIARAHFTAKVGELRDNMVDDLDSDVVTDVEPLRELVGMAESFARSPRDITLSMAYAMHRARAKYGDLVEPIFDPADLPIREREYYLQAEAVLIHRIADLILWNSALWWIFIPSRYLFRVYARTRGTRPPVSPQELAEELTRAPENRRQARLLAYA